MGNKIKNKIIAIFSLIIGGILVFIPFWIKSMFKFKDEFDLNENDLKNLR